MHTAAILTLALYQTSSDVPYLEREYSKTGVWLVEIWSRDQIGGLLLVDYLRFSSGYVLGCKVVTVVVKSMC